MTECQNRVVIKKMSLIEKIYGEKRRSDLPVNSVVTGCHDGKRNEETHRNQEDIVSCICN